MELTNFLSLIKQQFDLVTIIKGLHAVRSFIILNLHGFYYNLGFFNEIDDDEDDDDDDDDNIDDEDNNPNF